MDVPVNKNQIRRMGLIDKCIRRKYHELPNKKQIQEYLIENMGGYVSPSTIEKDLNVMRHIYGCKIVVIKGACGGYYYQHGSKPFPMRFKEQWGAYIDFDAGIIPVPTAPHLPIGSTIVE